MSRVDDSGAPDPIDVEVGARVRAIRNAKGMSQTALGKALGVSYQQMQKYERGANRISASVLVKIARCFGVRPSQLLPDSDNVEDAPGLLPTFAQVRGADDLVQSYARIESTRLRHSVLQLVRALATTRNKRGSDTSLQ